MKKVFLGGTCNGSTWRDELIPMLKIGYFNPVVDDWNEECQREEIKQRKTCGYCLYVITPRMTGVYSIAEVVDDSNKRPHRTVFCFLPADGHWNDTSRQPGSQNVPYEFTISQAKSLSSVAKMVVENGGEFFFSLKGVADYLNNPHETFKKQNGKVVFKGWAARDKECGEMGGVGFYHNKPRQDKMLNIFLPELGGEVTCNQSNYYLKDFMSELTWENSPKKVTITMEE